MLESHKDRFKEILYIDWGFTQMLTSKSQRILETAIILLDNFLKVVHPVHYKIEDVIYTIVENTFRFVLKNRPIKNKLLDIISYHIRFYPIQSKKGFDRVFQSHSQLTLEYGLQILNNFITHRYKQFVLFYREPLEKFLDINKAKVRNLALSYFIQVSKLFGEQLTKQHLKGLQIS